MNSKLIVVFGLLAVFAVVGSHATSATDKARAAAESAKDAAMDYVGDKVKHAFHDDPESMLDKAKHAVRDAAGNIIGGGVKKTAKAGMAAGAAKMAYETAGKIKERLWDDEDDDESDPEARSRNDRLRKACKQRSQSRSAAEECFKDAKEWNEIESDVDADGPSMYARVKDAYGSAKEYVTGEKKQEEKKGWL